MIRRRVADHLPSLARQQWRAWIETEPVSPVYRTIVCLARQQWRAWIETWRVVDAAQALGVSPASNGGRGLKQHPLRGPDLLAHVSPASNGGRGLKLHGAAGHGPDACLARQQWRAWIETTGHYTAAMLTGRLARQQWRAWIETSRTRSRTWVKPLSRPPAMAGVD